MLSAQHIPTYIAMIVTLIIGGAVVFSLMITMSAANPPVLKVDFSDFPTPAPTHTPAIPTPTPGAIPGPTAPAFRVAATQDPAITVADLSGRLRWNLNDRNLQFPQCSGAVSANATEYLWLAYPGTEPDLRSLIIDGLDQLGAFEKVSDTLDLGGGTTLTQIYRTRSAVRCGHPGNPGVGGAHFTIHLVGA